MVERRALRAKGPLFHGDDREAERQEFGRAISALPATRLARPLDDYDVWVSADRVIEWHAVRAKGPLFREKQGEEQTRPERGTVQHCRIESARSYQEFMAWGFLCAEVTSDASITVRKWHKWRWLTASGLVAGVLWMILR
jgi:hypothetical protein